MRGFRAWILVLCLAASGAVAGDDVPPLDAGFVGAPPQRLVVSEHGTLRWVDLRGDRRFQHGLPVGEIAVGADGTRIATSTGFADRTVRIWEASTGRLVRSAPVVDDPDAMGIASLVATPQGSRLVGVASGGAVVVLDLLTGETVRRFQRPCRGTSNVVVDASGRWMAVACVQDDARVVTVHDLETGDLRHVLRGVKSFLIQSVGMSSDGRAVFAWTSDEHLWVWDAATGAHLRTLKFPELLYEASVSPDGRWIVVHHEGLTLRDTKTGQVCFAVKAPISRRPGDGMSGQPNAFLGKMVFDPKGRWVATTHLHDGHLRIWDLKTARLLHDVALPANATKALAVSPDGSWIAVGGWDGAIRRIDPLQGTRLAYSAPDGEPMAVLAADRAGARTVAVQDGELIVRDEARGNVLHRLRHEATGNGIEVEAVAMSPDGRRIVSAAGSVAVWDGETGKQLRAVSGRKNDDRVTPSWLGSTEAVSSVTVDPHHKWFAAAYHLGQLCVYDARTGQPLHRWSQRGLYPQLAAAADGTRLLASIVGRESAIAVLDPAGGAVLSTIALGDTLGGPAPFAVSPASSWFAVHTPAGISIYEIETGRKLRTLESSAAMGEALAIAPDGPYVYAAGWDSGVSVWDADTGVLLDRIRVDAPVKAIVARGSRVWVSLGNGTTQIYRHTPAAD